MHMLYTVNDPAGYCVGVFDNLTQAKEHLLKWAEMLLDNPTIVNIPYDHNGGPVACIVDEYGQFLLEGHTPTHNMGEYSISCWILNKGV